VRSALEGVDGVQSAKVSLDKNNAVVVFDSSKATIEQMKAAVKEAGYGISSASEIKPSTDSKADTTEVKQTESQAGNYRTMSIDQLAKVTDDPTVTLINVHIPYAGEIPGTDEFLPFNKIQQNNDKLPSDKKAEVVLYCRSGHMSKMASKVLTEMGYTNVYDVPGGMNAWRSAGNELLHKSQ